MSNNSSFTAIQVMSPAVQSIKALLSEIVDYAGLFPPSNIPMADAVRNYAEYLKSEHSWMLGRFIVPVRNLDKFNREAERYFNDTPWRISAIIGEDVAGDLKKIVKFNKKNEGHAVIETIEVKSATTDDIHAVTRILPENLIAYFEVPQNEVLTEFMTTLAVTKNRAKIRTGGLTQDDFPSTDAIIKFMRICIAANVPFKATAGLHHPLRCIKPLSYEDDAPKGMMHGFLNLFFSAAFLRQDLNNSFVHKLMNETEVDDFHFDEDILSWNGRTVSQRTVEILRQKNAISFGSCSFTEPVEDLQRLGLID